MIPTQAHVAMYRTFLRLFPAHHRARHGRDQLQLFTDLLTTGHSPVRLWLGAVPDLVTVLGQTPGRTAMSHLARLALFPLSVLNAAAGSTLAAVSLATSAVPAWVAAPAAAIAMQGLYTLAWLGDVLPMARRRGNVLFATGEAAALAIGATGLVSALITQSGTTDPEYGPPTMLTIVALHGLIGLLAPPRPSGRPTKA